MKGNISKLIFYVIISTIVASCNNIEEPTEVSDYDTIITNVSGEKKSFFQTAKTFSIPEYVAHIGEDSTIEHAHTSMDELIISQTILNMENAGYQLVNTEDDVKPDLIVLPYTYDVVIVESYSYWPGYWSGYWGNYWGWYGYGFPYYPYPMTSYYAYSKGTVFLEITENRETSLDEIKETQEIPIIWQGIINGVQSNTIDHQQRVSDGIDQLFLQSPYIYTE